MDDTDPGSAALAEAERWFARRMTGGCTRAERKAFERWRATPGHAVAYARTEQLWQGIGGLAGNPELERLSTEALSATAPRVRKTARDARRTPWWLAVPVAACLMAAFAVTTIMFRDPVPPPVIHATGPDQRRTVRLADGSRVVLNVDTEIAARMGDDTRELTLIRGEALFEVAHDAQRPFRVGAGGGAVTALGTRFQVGKHDGEVMVTLLQGSVAIEREDTDEHLRLQPGQQASFAVDGGRIATRTVDVDVVSSWTRGRLLFRATPLAEVVAEVNRYADTPLRLADASLGATPVSGTFPIGDSKSVALALQALLPIQADMAAGNEITLRRKSE